MLPLSAQRKALVPLAATVLSWLAHGATTGDWTPDDQALLAAATLLVWATPNAPSRRQQAATNLDRATASR